MVASGEPKGVAAVKANGRGQIWGPIFLLYLAMQGVYFFARDCDGPIANGALFPIFVLLGGALYLWGLDRLDPVTRLIYREATRTAIEKRWWPPIMSVLAGAVFLAMTVVTVGETRSAWVTPVMFLISMSLLGAGATVIARKIKRLRVPKDTALIADRPRR
jgi:peptidoglycan/LPS O-acetylase OafA/YrhL